MYLLSTFLVHLKFAKNVTTTNIMARQTHVITAIITCTLHFNVIVLHMQNIIAHLPGKYLAISAHLLPSLACRLYIRSSSSRLHAALLTSGFKWLCHLSMSKLNYDDT